MSELPPVTDRPVLPEVRATATVTFAVGAWLSVTPNVPVVPCVTDSVDGVAMMAGVRGRC